MTTFHVFGSGSAQDPKNHIYRARLDAPASLWKDGDTFIVYGRQQPGQERSEARSGGDYLMQDTELGKVNPILVQVLVDEEPKSTSETMARVVKAIYFSYTRQQAGGSDPYRHVIVINWPYMGRAKYLLRKQWQRSYPHIPWKTVAPMVDYLPVGGTFKPYAAEKGLLRAVPWWLVHVLGYNTLAWVKALRDPYDKRINQDRKTSRKWGA